MFLRKNDIVIRDFSLEDIPLKVEWINNPENNYFLHYDLPLEIKKTQEWFLKRSINRIDCIIEYNQIPVGLIGFLNIDSVNCKAEFYITIGDTSFKRKGIGLHATQLMIEFAFSQLELNKIYLNVDEENNAACALYEKAGFYCEGNFIKELFHNGKFINRKRYAILSDKI